MSKSTKLNLLYLSVFLVSCGGSDPAPANTAVTETYDGTSYSEVNDLNAARRFAGGCGTQTAALAFAGSQLVIG